MDVRNVRTPIVGSRSALSARVQPAEVPHLLLWGIVWAASVLMIFEPQIRNALGDQSEQLSTSLLPGVWLSDIGLLLPIILVVFSPRLKALLMSRRLLGIYGLVVTYGVIWGLMRGNFFSAVMAEVRISLALVTGLCLVLLAPQRPQSLARGMIGVSLAAVCVSILAISTSSTYTQLTAVIGVSDPVYFIVISVALCLLAPSIILAHVIGSRTLILAAWFNVGLALVSAVIVAITRTLSYTLILSVVLAMVGVVVLLYATKQKRRLKWLGAWLLVLALAAGLAISAQQAQFEAFWTRVQMQGTEADINWLTRVNEAQDALNTMTFADQLIGQGFGTQSPVRAITGETVYILHIGILNVWWRLGLPAFVVFGWLLLRFGQEYFSSLIQALKFRLSSKVRAMIICAPGVWALLMTFLVSGGWSVAAMLSLGILWGVYNCLKSLEMNRLSQPER